ncbi:MAG: glycosyltransferase [Pirellulales bacterium]
MDWLTTLYWTAIVGAAIVSLLITWQAFEHRRFARSRSQHRPGGSHHRHVALFVPCKGADVDLEANLRPLFEQDYGNYEIVFVVESMEDPACRTIRRVMEQYPGTQSRLAIAGISTSTGQKVHNLLVATENLPQRVEVLVFVDADVCPPRDWLSLLTVRLHDAPVSTGYRCFVPKRATLANCILSSINGAVVPIMFPGKHHLIWGGSWAILRDVWESSGLRDAWRGTLSDDLIATRVMAQKHHDVAAEPMCMLPSPLDVDWRSMFGFVRRQLIIGRCYVPVHWYALLFGSSVMQGLFWGSLVAAGWGLVSGAAWTWQPTVAVGLLYALHLWRAHLRHDASRYYLPYRQGELAAARRFDIWFGPVAGVVGWLGLVCSAFTRRIVWKGIVYEMYPGGRIKSIERPKAGDAAAPVQPPSADTLGRAA